jgi:DNA-binding response OmpR family regulator
LQTALKNSQYSILSASTTDHAVALCVANVVVAAVVDAEFMQGQEWPVVKSLKGVRLNLPIILVDPRGTNREDPLPEGVDAVLSPCSPAELRNKIDELVKKADPAA